MKKITTILLAVIILTVFPAAAWGLNTPAVSRNHGVVTARFIGDLGLFLGAEYGVTSELALLAELGPKEMSRIGLKYQVGRMAVTGGVTGSAVFFGLNGSGALGDKLTGIFEVDAVMNKGNLGLLYEVGVKFDIDQKVDLRGGLFGGTSGSVTTLQFQIGAGYKF
ncbi:MAG: hypothetical protein GX085_06265 [Firmicutes bacterium]|nr:hypothetical protein [Bacillota bacterium]